MTIRSGSSSCELLLVELVERLAALGALAHGAVDLAGAEPLGDHAAREVRKPLDALGG